MGLQMAFNEKYEVLSLIGEGSFSKVFKVRDRSTGILYAAKQLKKKIRTKEAIINCNEISALKRLENHANIIELVDIIWDQHLKSLNIIFDLMSMNLCEYQAKKKKPLTECESRELLYQIVSGVKHLHSNGIFHRDIKPENILLLFGSGSLYSIANASLKLSDFGSAATVYLDNNDHYTAYIATRWYRAPECLLTSGCYGPKLDIWSTGCVFYEMLTLLPLFPGGNELDQLDKIHQVLGTPSKASMGKFGNLRVKCSFPKYKAVHFKKLLPNLSTSGIRILEQTLQYCPCQRVNIFKLFNDSYFKNIRRPASLPKFQSRKSSSCTTLTAVRRTPLS